jgi:hypothetical protein
MPLIFNNMTGHGEETGCLAFTEEGQEAHSFYNIFYNKFYNIFYNKFYNMFYNKFYNMS